MQDITTKRKLSVEKDPSIVKDSNGVPSGFVLKLYQMVNGAPDEIISVSYTTWSLSFFPWTYAEIPYNENEISRLYRVNFCENGFGIRKLL